MYDRAHAVDLSKGNAPQPADSRPRHRVEGGRRRQDQVDLQAAPRWRSSTTAPPSTPTPWSGTSHEGARQGPPGSSIRARWAATASRACPRCAARRDRRPDAVELGHVRAGLVPAATTSRTCSWPRPRSGGRSSRAVPASVTDAAERSKQAWVAFAADASGTGPFKMTRFVPRERLELASEHQAYWDSKRVPKIDKVVMVPMPEANARTAALLGEPGGLDRGPRAGRHRPDQEPRLRGLRQRPAAHVAVAALVRAEFPWLDKRVRRGRQPLRGTARA